MQLTEEQSHRLCQLLRVTTLPVDFEDKFQSRTARREIFQKFQFLKDATEQIKASALTFKPSGTLEQLQFYGKILQHLVRYSSAFIIAVPVCGYFLLKVIALFLRATQIPFLQFLASILGFLGVVALLISALFLISAVVEVDINRDSEFQSRSNLLKNLAEIDPGLAPAVLAPTTLDDQLRQQLAFRSTGQPVPARIASAPVEDVAVAQSEAEAPTETLADVEKTAEEALVRLSSSAWKYFEPILLIVGLLIGAQVLEVIVGSLGVTALLSKLVSTEVSQKFLKEAYSVSLLGVTCVILLQYTKVVLANLPDDVFSQIRQELVISSKTAKKLSESTHEALRELYRFVLRHSAHADSDALKRLYQLTCIHPGAKYLVELIQTHRPLRNADIDAILEYLTETPATHSACLEAAECDVSSISFQTFSEENAQIPMKYSFATEERQLLLATLDGFAPSSAFQLAKFVQRITGA